LGFGHPPTRLSLHDIHGGNNTRRNSCDEFTKHSHGEDILHDMIPNMIENQPEKEANEKKLSPVRWKQKDQEDKQQNKSDENGQTLDEHIIDFMETDNLSHVRSDQVSLGASNHQIERKKPIFVDKRVTIHYVGQDRTILKGQHGKLIILPDSLEELLKIVGKHPLKHSVKILFCK